jgi:hypothetical protein
MFGKDEAPPSKLCAAIYGIEREVFQSLDADWFTFRGALDEISRCTRIGGRDAGHVFEVLSSSLVSRFLPDDGTFLGQLSRPHLYLVASLLAVRGGNTAFTTLQWLLREVANGKVAAAWVNEGGSLEEVPKPVWTSREKGLAFDEALYSLRPAGVQVSGLKLRHWSGEPRPLVLNRHGVQQAIALLPARLKGPEIGDVERLRATRAAKRELERWMQDECGSAAGRPHKDDALRLAVLSEWAAYCIAEREPTLIAFARVVEDAAVGFQTHLGEGSRFRFSGKGEGRLSHSAFSKYARRILAKVRETFPEEEDAFGQ